MMKLTTYDKYKNSEAEWLGTIPEHWELYRIKDFTYVKGRIGWQGLRSDEFLDNTDYYCVTGQDFKNGIVDWENCYCVEQDRFDQDTKIQLQIGDLLITKDGTIGKLALVKSLPKKATLNSGVFLTRPNKGAYSNDFMFWLLSSSIFTNFIDFTKNGSTILHLYQNVFVRFLYPLPSPLEQTKIANYLDQATTKIDKKIDLLTQKIKHYQDLKTALINRAVTKGLDDSVEMKDSGVEWSPQIPKHWNIRPLKFIAEAIIGLTYSPNDVCDEGEGTLVLRASNIQNGKLVFGKNVFVNKEIPKKLKTKKFDIIICSRSGSRNLIGKCGLVEENFIDLTFGAFNTLVRSSMNQFLFYILSSNLFKAEAGKYMTTTINQLTIRTLKSFLVPIPPRSEQNKIVEYLNHKTSIIDKIIQTITTQIEHQKELRKTLINDVVTGKVKVENS